MNVNIRFSEVTPSPLQSEFIRRRLESALSTRQKEIERVDVSVLGIRRIDGGRLKFCKVDVTLSDGRMVSSDSTEEDLQIAVHRSADRVGWEVARSLGRKHRQAMNRPYPPAQLDSVARQSA